MNEPKPLLICAVGPSRPAAPPDPIVIAEATSFTGITRSRVRPPFRWNASIAASVP